MNQQRIKPPLSSIWVEVVVSNRFNPGYRMEMYARNITDNWPEKKIMDSNGTWGGGGGPWIPSPTLTPAEINVLFRFDVGAHDFSYRAGICPGWIGQSHWMMAQWDTNAGQRIGPATEVEGGTSDTTPPAAPTGLRAF